MAKGPLGTVLEVTESIEKTAESAEKGIESLGSAFSNLNDSILKGGNTLEQFSKGIDLAGKSMKNMVNVFGNFIDIFPGLKPFGDIFKNLGGIFGNIGETISAIISGFEEFIGTIDEMTRINRELKSSIYEVGAAFGDSLLDASNYSNQLLDSLKDLSTQEFGFIRLNEITEFIKNAKSSKVSMEELSSSVNIGGESMKAYGAAVLQAASLGLNASEYMKQLGDAIYGQGLSIEEAMKQFSLFKSISKDTGIVIDDVSSILTNLSRSMRTMGIQADFGEPILRGFAKSLSDIGLGAENAQTLTENLGKAIGKIASDPALAYVTSQLGGLTQYGSGGTALGASIDLQAKILEAEKTGDQSQVAFEITKAMKETLEKFGQGRIVTVTEASRDSSLETTFYTQQKILENIFGVQSDNSARTLEMLAQLEDAYVTGDDKTARQLAEDIALGKNVRNNTLSFQDKINSQLDSVIGFLSSSTSNLQTIATAIGDNMINDVFSQINPKIESLFANTDVINSNLSTTADSLLSGENLSDNDIKAEVSSVMTQNQRLIDSLENSSTNINLDLSNLIPYLDNMVKEMRRTTAELTTIRTNSGGSITVPGTVGAR